MSHSFSSDPLGSPVSPLEGAESSGPDLPPEVSDLDQQVQRLQAQVNDLKVLTRLDSLPMDEWQAVQTELLALEERIREYWGELNPSPELFWQVVRLGGLGFLLGMAVQRWIFS